MHFLTKIIVVFLFIFILLSSYITYFQGLNGPFIFDDFVNLEVFEKVEDKPLLTKIVQIIFSYEHGPIGRPISFASFLIHGTTPPTSAWDYKYTNLLIHLLNGILVFWLIYRLLSLSKHNQTQIILISLATMALWLLHPMQNSTVLYVIQRMVELSTLFTLAAMISYTYFRQLAISQPKIGYLSLTFWLILFGIFAVLSKENGALLLFYILIIEFFWLRSFVVTPPKHYPIWASIILYLPALLIIFYLLYSIPNTLTGYELKNFTLSERLLTQPIILLEYIYKIFFPQLASSGLWHDHYPISKGLFTPIQTFFAIITIITLLLTSIFIRKIFPILAFAILWFFAGHLIESTIFPLELYFEHRNYLAMLGMLFLITYILFITLKKIRIITGIAFILYLGLFIFISYNNSYIWSEEKRLLTIWSQENPTSPRAYQSLAKYYSEQGNWHKALQLTEKAKYYADDQMGYFIQSLYIKCATGQTITELEKSDLLKTITLKKFDNLMTATTKKFIDIIDDGSCAPYIDLKYLESLLLTLISSPNHQNPIMQRYIYELLAYNYIKMGNLEKTILSLDEIHKLNLSKHISRDIYIYQAQLLISADLYQYALEYANKAKEILNKGNPVIKWVKQKEIDQLIIILKNTIQYEQAN